MQKKNSYIVFVVWVMSIFYSPSTFADFSDFELQLWNKSSHDFRKDSSTEDTFTNHLETKAEYSISNLGINVGAELDFFYMRNSLDDDGRVELRPYETYHQYDGENFSSKIGYHIVRWGKTDEVSPFDVIASEDFRDGFIRTRSERKFATPTIQLQRFFEDSTFEFLVKPIAQADKFDLTDSDWALLGNQRGLQEPFVDIQSSNFALDNVSIGARYSFQLARIDFSLDAFSGISTSPLITQSNNQSQQSQVPSFQVTYERINFVGFEASRDIEEYVLRADVMLSMNEAMTSEIGRKARGEFLKYVLGIERQFDSDLYVNLQFGQMVRVSSEDKQNPLLKDTQGVYAFVSYPLMLNEVLIGVRGYADPRRSSGNINPYAILHNRGDWNVEVGADLFLGEFMLFGQRVMDNDQGYVIFNFKL